VTTKQGRTIMFVSHNMAAIESMCGSALLLVNGRRAAQGATLVVVQEYLRDISRASTIPLGERTERSGSGEIRFLSFEPEGPFGSKISAFQCGTDATCHFVIENCTDRVLRNLNVAFGVDNEMGHRVALLDTGLIGTSISDIAPGRENVRVFIPKLPLMPGRYMITIYATVNGILADWIKNAAIFDVEMGDYYGTGRLPHQREGMFLLQHKFNVGNAFIMTPHDEKVRGGLTRGAT
jgi:lipopolysaccharide transport system ATP-binding protein